MNCSKFFISVSKFIQMNYLKELITRNTGVSSKSFFLVSVTIIGFILLLVPAIILIVEVYCNHTIQTDLNGLAAYIAAVAGVFASAGITKAWSEKYEKRNDNEGNKPCDRKDSHDYNKTNITINK